MSPAMSPHSRYYDSPAQRIRRSNSHLTPTSTRSTHSFGDLPRTPASARSRRSPEDSGAVCLDPSGHREKLPRPEEDSFWSLYDLDREEDGGGSQTNRQTELNAARRRSSPRQFLWPTLETIALRPYEVASSFPLPLAAVCSPFADTGDASCPLVERASQQGPVRCPRCRCYINPFFAWAKREERKLQCNMCGYAMEAPDHFVEALEQTGGREGAHPELAGGSVDFPAPPHFDPDRPTGPVAPASCVMLETSTEAVLSGLASSMLDAVEHLLADEESLLSQRRVCLITFDDAINFFTPGKSGRFSKIAMPDLEDPFCPVEHEILFASPGDEGGFHGLVGLLQQLRLDLAEEAATAAAAAAAAAAAGADCVAQTTGVGARAAYRAAVEALTAVGGGDLVAVHATDQVAASQPSFGAVGEPCSPCSPTSPWSPAAASSRRTPSHAASPCSSSSPQKLASSPTTRSIGSFTPSRLRREKSGAHEVDAFTQDTLALCVKGGVAVSVVTAPASEVTFDVSRMQWLAWRTGGDTLHMPGFSLSMQVELEDHLQHWGKKAKDSAYGCVFKLRCSKGLVCKSMVAPWPAAVSATDYSAFELPRMSPDTTVTFTLAPDYDTSDEDEYWGRPRDQRNKVLYVQAVVLHTNCSGQRLLRVHNTPIHVVNSVRQVFSGISIAPLVSVALKQAASLAIGRAAGSSKVLPRDFLLDFCLKAIASYNRHCYSSSGGKSVVVGRQLSLLPLLTLSARKLMFHLTGGVSNKDLADERLRAILRMPVHSVMVALYPRVYALPAELGEEQPLPARPSLVEYITKAPSSGALAYLICNGFGSWFYQHDYGAGAPMELTQQLWQNAHELNALLCEAMGPAAVRAPLRWLPRLNGSEVASPSTAFDGASWEDKVLLSTLFVEEEGATEMSYPDWIQYIREELHRSLDERE